MKRKLVLWVAVGAFLMAPIPALAATDGQSAITKSNPSPTTVESKPRLGVTVRAMSPVLASHLTGVIENGQGVIVERVVPDSPAAHAGLQQHDILIRYRDQDIYSTEQLFKLVLNGKPGREAELSYVRGGQLKNATVHFAEVAPEEPSTKTPRGDYVLRHQDSADAVFKSMMTTMLDDGNYKIEFAFRDKDGQLLRREFEGTREEILSAIEMDSAIPAEHRAFLRGELDRKELEFLQIPWLRGFYNDLLGPTRNWLTWPVQGF